MGFNKTDSVDYDKWLYDYYPLAEDTPQIINEKQEKFSAKVKEKDDYDLAKLKKLIEYKDEIVFEDFSGIPHPSFKFSITVSRIETQEAIFIKILAFRISLLAPIFSSYIVKSAIEKYDFIDHRGKAKQHIAYPSTIFINQQDNDHEKIKGIVHDFFKNKEYESMDMLWYKSRIEKMNFVFDPFCTVFHGLFGQHTLKNIRVLDSRLK